MIALAIAVHAGVRGVSALPPVLRTAVAAIALFGVCGYAPARGLVRGDLVPYRMLLVLPVGAALSSLALAVLGVLHVPFGVSLPVVVAAGVLSILYVHRPGAHATSGWADLVTSARRIGVPLALAALVGAVSLVPVFRSGFATVPGQNGDAILVVGSADLVEHAPPTATRLDLPINRIPLQWRSKYPIYYALAAVSTIAGESPIQAFATVAAMMLALTALGVFAFARYALRAPPWVAWLAMFLLPLDRIVMYVTIHPYYNELWGQFTLPFTLLAGWQYVTRPSRAALGFLVTFTVLGLLAYPLMLPFPLFYLLAAATLVWRRRRAEGTSPGWISALRLPPLHRRPWVLVPVLIVAVPVCLVLVRGVVEKSLSAVSVLAPGSSLAGWYGAALPYLPGPRFVGMPGSGWADYVGLACVCVLAVLGARRARAGIPLLFMAAVTAVIGIYFRIRHGGQLFFFKDMAFLGPYLLLLALLEVAARLEGMRAPRRILGAAGLLAAVVLVPVSAAREIDQTFDNATPSILQLHAWDRALPPGSTLRIDVPPTGYQLWTTFMFNDHPISALHPLGGFFPHPPRGRKADYVIAERTQPRPADAVGAPLFENAQFILWKMNPSVPGPDVSSRRLEDITGIVTGF